MWNSYLGTFINISAMLTIGWKYIPGSAFTAETAYSISTTTIST